MKKNLEIPRRSSSALCAGKVKFDIGNSNSNNNSNSYSNMNFDDRRLSTEKEKAYYYSQLSAMLFEKVTEEDSGFVEDLNRVQKWFIEEINESQKIVCLKELLSKITSSQQRFLFNLVSHHSETENESAMFRVSTDSLTNTSIKMETDTDENYITETSRKTEIIIPRPQPKMSDNKKEQIIFTDNFNFEDDDRLKSLDLTPFCPNSESLFTGIKMPTAPLSKLIPFERVMMTPIFSADSIDRSRSVDAFQTLITGDSFYNFDDVTSGDANELLPTRSLMSPNYLESLNKTNNAKKDETKCRSTNIFKEQVPPGFLSANAMEFRPCEPSTHTTVFITNFSAWLRLLRLHKYHDQIKSSHEKDWKKLLSCDGVELEKLGVSALGARMKFLRLFEKIRHELMDSTLGLSAETEK